MIDIKEIDKELYYQRYIRKDYDKLNKLWNEIKSNKELLEEAIMLTKNKFGEDTLKSLSICECMLITYDKVDKEVYQKLEKMLKNITSVSKLIENAKTSDQFVYQLFDEFQRFQLKMGYDIYLKAKMAGAQDIKEPDDWMKDIHE